MRPPDLPGGNAKDLAGKAVREVEASMRPPDLPGGNPDRRPRLAAAASLPASMRPPDLPGGNKHISRNQITRQVMLQ